MLLLLCAVDVAWPGYAIAETKSELVGIVLTQHPSYKKAAATLRAELEAAKLRCLFVELPESLPKQESTTKPAAEGAADSEDDRNHDKLRALRKQSLTPITKQPCKVIVTVGRVATHLVLESTEETPVVFCMIPDALDVAAIAPDSPLRTRVAGLAINPSPDAQTTQIISMIGTKSKLGILKSPRSERTAAALIESGRKKGLQYVAIDADADQFPAAIDELERHHCEGVFMLPDSEIYNTRNVQQLLLWGLRNKEPVWAFSGNVVKAGAFAGCWVEHDELGRQTAKLTQRVLEGADLEKLNLVYPDEFKTGVNLRTADMINVRLSSNKLSQVTVKYDNR